MGDLSSVTQGTAVGSQQAAASVASLAALADDLRASVAAFRLDADRAATHAGHGNGHGHAPAPARGVLVGANGAAQY
jgi:hypothetical protein